MIKEMWTLDIQYVPPSLKVLLALMHVGDVTFLFLLIL